SERAINPPANATGTNNRNQRRSSPPPSTPGIAAANAPSDPAAAATALYAPKPCTWARPRRPAANMGCSSEVNGPDSITSVDNTPVNATAANSHTDPLVANTPPTTPSKTYSP